jgi:uncharacterized protein (DUF58 family)
MRRLVPYLLLLFLIAAVLRVDFFFTIVYLLFTVTLLSRLWTRRVSGQLRAERSFVNRAFSGDQLRLRLTVRNDGWLPVPWLHVHESLPVELTTPPSLREVISLGPQGRHAFTTTLDCRRRGYYDIGPLRLQAGDLLGLVGPRRVEMRSECCIVYPRVLPLQELGLPTRSPLVALSAPTPLFEDPARIMGVRDYRQGDSPRRIHWTATASAGQLLVKQYEPSIARETLVCLDLTLENYEGRRRYTATELAIVVAASIAHHVVVNEGLPVGLATEGWDPLAETRARFFLPPRSGRAQLMGLLEVLARIEVAEVTPFPDLLRRESVNLPWGATLTVIAGRESEALFDTLVYLRRAGFAVALILVQPAYVSADLRGRADLLGMPVHHVWQEVLSFPHEG